MAMKQHWQLCSERLNWNCQNSKKPQQKLTQENTSTKYVCGHNDIDRSELLMLNAE
jgi:hypothetical protein